MGISRGLRAHLVTAVAVILGGALGGCSSGFDNHPPATPTDLITGGASCPAREAQDLTFSGRVTGHIACSTAPAVCSRANVTARSKDGLDVPVSAKVGSSPVQLVLDWLRGDVPGTLVAGQTGDGPDFSEQGASLDGIGHWATASGAGTMTIAVDDAAGASGTADIKLTSDHGLIRVSGSWRCLKPAGF